MSLGEVSGKDRGLGLEGCVLGIVRVCFVVNMIVFWLCSGAKTTLFRQNAQNAQIEWVFHNSTH